MDELRYADAVAAYAKGYELRPDPVFLYNLGRAHQALGNYPAALDELERFKSEAPPALRTRVAGLDGLLERVRARVATIVVHCNVPARVRLGDTPIECERAVHVNAGAGTLAASADGYAPIVREVTLDAGDAPQAVTLTLRNATAASLRVSSAPAGATLSLDGKAMGALPYEGEVDPGVHRLVVEKPGFEPFRTTVDVPPGESKRVTARLDEEPGLGSRWWFWTGVAVVVAAAAPAATAAALGERGPDHGSLAPGLVRF
jgi:hypothetical protein